MPARTEELAARLMAEILADRQFQRFWTEKTAEVMSVRREVRGTPVPSVVSEQPAEKPVEEAEVENSLELLVPITPIGHGDSKWPTESNGSTARRPPCTPSASKSTVSSLPTASSTRNSSFVARRLGHLIKTFTIRVSSAFDIPTMSFFACSLCEMLYRLEEFVSIHRPTAKCSLLRRATDDFYTNVVKGMNKLQLQRNLGRWRSTQSLRAGRSTAMSHAQTGGTSTPPLAQKSPLVFYRKSYSDPRPKSFLLPADLAEAPPPTAAEGEQEGGGWAAGRLSTFRPPRPLRTAPRPSASPSSSRRAARRSKVAGRS
ncbi:hypothetical protein M3Y99_01099300 [Aphelenchoides fujianensis]|nr:hypothetical protein M3Y99_01099300 [Aphelenchoides fujianensis]